MERVISPIKEALYQLLIYRNPRVVNFSEMYSIGSVTGCESKEAKKSWTISCGTLIDWRPWHVLWLPVASQCQNNYRREFTVAKWLGTNHSLNLIKHITKYMLICNIHTRINWMPYLFYFHFAKEYDKNITWFFSQKFFSPLFLLYYSL